MKIDVPYGVSGVYKITSPTGRIYIGQSVDIRRRFLCYRNVKCENQTKLYSSFKKHGVSKHLFEIVERCGVDELITKEAYYIDVFKCFNNKNGLNLRAGGGSKSKLSKETIARISASKKGKKIVFSDEHKKKLSDAAKVRIYTKEGLVKMSLAQMGKVVSKETKIKMSLAQKGKPHPNKGTKRARGAECKNSKKVFQYSMNGKLIKEWYGTYEVYRKLGYSPSNINMVLLGKRKTANGFLWKREAA